MTQSLIERLQAASGPDNALDVLVEVAMFKPSRIWASCRANDAGTKVIYVDHNGRETTCWAVDWCDNRAAALTALLARESTP